MLSDHLNTYAWNAESQIKTAGGVNYTYDGDGDRVQKSNGKIYWYGAGSEILDESDASGNITDEYIFFGGKRIARRDSSGNVVYYVADHLGTSRVVANSTGGILDQSDFYPFGGEHVFTSSSGNTYKFESKERDAETNNDDFGARYYSSVYGRFLTADWSAIPVPVPYANLTNPQTLNLYAIVSDNPETFADLDGHVWSPPEGGCADSALGSCNPQSNPGTAQNQTTQNQINVSVAVVTEPQMLDNVHTQQGNVSGVGAILSYTYTDSSGKPLAGASVTEKNTVNDNGKIVERSGAITTDSKGTINDVVGKVGPSSTMPGTIGDVKGYVTSTPITITNTQTQTITSGGHTYTATSTRTLTNVGSNGKLNTKFNSHGVNFTISFTKPVVTTQ